MITVMMKTMTVASLRNYEESHTKLCGDKEIRGLLHGTEANSGSGTGTEVGGPRLSFARRESVGSCGVSSAFSPPPSAPSE